MRTGPGGRNGRGRREAVPLPMRRSPGGAAACFSVLESAGRPSGEHTPLAWQVDDVGATVALLRGRGVVFEEYDAPGLHTVDGIAEVEGNYPSAGGGERAAWFYDSEGNLHGLGQAIPLPTAPCGQILRLLGPR
jgi:hypothetical protein